MSIGHLIASYGCMAVFIGTLFEGEAVVILGGYAAHQGYLSLEEVILAAFTGACLGDQFYFVLGRHQGRDFLSRRPAWKSRAARAARLIERFHLWIIPLVRYLYGMRVVLCLAIGMSRIPGWRFTVLNALGVAVWALLMAFGGFYFGRAMTTVIEDAKRFELAAAAAIAAVGLGLWWIRRRRHRKE